MRLEKALGVLKRDRAVLEGLVTGFNESTRHAEAGVERLRAATEGAGRQIARQIEQAQRLRDDLSFLTERGDKLAERLDGSVRTARMLADQAAMSSPAQASLPPLPSLPFVQPPPPRRAAEPEFPRAAPVVESVPETKLRSEAERDLLRALRAVR
jgi:hypothetical protein